MPMISPPPDARRCPAPARVAQRAENEEPSDGFRGLVNGMVISLALWGLALWVFWS